MARGSGATEEGQRGEERQEGQEGQELVWRSKSTWLLSAAALASDTMTRKAGGLTPASQLFPCRRYSVCPPREEGSWWLPRLMQQGQDGCAERVRPRWLLLQGACQPPHRPAGCCCQPPHRPAGRCCGGAWNPCCHAAGASCRAPLPSRSRRSRSSSPRRHGPPAPPRSPRRHGSPAPRRCAAVPAAASCDSKTCDSKTCGDWKTCGGGCSGSRHWRSRRWSCSCQSRRRRNGCWTCGGGRGAGGALAGRTWPQPLPPWPRARWLWPPQLPALPGPC